MLKARLCETFWHAGPGEVDSDTYRKTQLLFVLVDDLQTITTDEIEKLEQEIDEHERHQAD